MGNGARAPRRTAIEVRSAVKIYGAAGSEPVRALDDVSLAIRDNEFFTLLGPSGCGKTTLLRVIAGFEELSDGRVYLFDAEIEHLPPNRRPVNTVFQHYALFPHMSVAQNVAFGLEMLGRPKDEIRRTTAEMLGLVQMDRLGDRRPGQLSGGQQQRVALARALATHPKVLLLDEPLSALDLKLRQEMRGELKRLQEETGITFLFVTHDQEEALTMSDRIAVMSAGRVQQVGVPAEIYEQPVNRFVADFIGETNLLEVEILGREAGHTACRLPGGEVLHAVGDGPAASTGSVSIRPEKLALAASEDAAARLHGEVERLVYLGTDTQYVVRLRGGQAVTARQQNTLGAAPLHAPGAAVGVLVPPGAVRLLEGE